MTIYVILVIRSDLFYSIGSSRATKIITPSDPTRETDHLDHDPYYQVIVNRITLLSKKVSTQQATHHQLTTKHSPVYDKIKQ